MSKVPVNVRILDADKIRAIQVQADLVREGDFFLAGGTGLGLRLGHRRSKDLDWFTAKNFDASELADRLSALPEKPTHLEQDGPRTIRAYYGELETSFIFYKQVPAKPERFAVAGTEIPVADLEVIAAMKAGAIHSRGFRRDFIDVHAISGAPGWSVARFIEHAAKVLPFEPEQVARALTYFQDAEREPMPEGYVGTWQQVKKDLDSGVRQWERDRREREALAQELSLTTEIRDPTPLHRLGLRPETLAHERFGSAIRQAPDGSPVFAFLDNVGLAGLARLSGPTTNKGVWISRASPDDTTLVLVDSPVEALSYHQCHPNRRARFLATGPTMSPAKADIIAEAVAAMPGPSDIVLAFPETPAGRRLADRVRASLPGKAIEQAVPPRGSSWSAYVQEQQRDWIRAQGLQPPARGRNR